MLPAALCMVIAAGHLGAVATTAIAWEPAPRGQIQLVGKARDLQWGLNRVGAEDAWPASTGEGVTVAVIDTGVDAGHPDLAGSVVKGYDAFRRKSFGRVDRNGHGTHVAGTIAAHGVVEGVAPDVKIMPIRTMNARGIGLAYHVVAGIKWAVRHGADIINMSIGSNRPDAAEKKALRAARKKGVLVVAAAGNGKAAKPSYPAAYDDLLENATTGDLVIGVGALTAEGKGAAFSRQGNPVDLMAPGTKVLSTFTRSKQPYSWESGTSMAAPFVSATAALALSYVRAVRPGISKTAAAAEVDQALRGADTVSAPDVLARLGAPTWSGMPADLSFTGDGEGFATVRFTPPAGTSATAVLTSEPGSGGAKAAPHTDAGTTIWTGEGGAPVTVSLTGLAPNTSYAVTVFTSCDEKKSRSVIGLRPFTWSMRAERLRPERELTNWRRRS